jgi:hypothetical protein
MSTLSEHWNAIFSSKKDAELGWHENDASQTAKFLDLIPQHKDATVFLPGAGTSVLIDALLGKVHHVIANDLSEAALGKLRARFGMNDRLSLLHHDVSQPLSDKYFNSIDLWIDRAVLHFLIKEEEIQGYFTNLQAAVRPGGHVLLAEFSTQGAQKCAGLEVRRYSIEEMTMRLGADFELVTHEEHTCINPFGSPRPYIYALFKHLGVTA